MGSGRRQGGRDPDWRDSCSAARWTRPLACHLRGLPPPRAPTAVPPQGPGACHPLGDIWASRDFMESAEAQTPSPGPRAAAKRSPRSPALLEPPPTHARPPALKCGRPSNAGVPPPASPSPSRESSAPPSGEPPQPGRMAPPHLGECPPPQELGATEFLGMINFPRRK